VRPDDLEGCHSMDRMSHRVNTTLTKWIDLERRPAGPAIRLLTRLREPMKRLYTGPSSVPFRMGSALDAAVLYDS
jgi:hypothetical protein